MKSGGTAKCYGGAVQSLHSPPPYRKDSLTVVGMSNLYAGAIKPLPSPAMQKGHPTVRGLNFTHKLQNNYKIYALHAS